MKKITCFFTISLLISIVIFSPYNLANEETVINTSTQKNEILYIRQCGNGYRYNIQGWIYTSIEGDPYERGFQHGYLLSEEIVDLMARWSNMIHNHPYMKPLSNRFSQERYEKISENWWNFCKKQSTRIYLDNFPDEYKEEIRGIAAGVRAGGDKIYGEDVTLEDVLTSNQMYELMSKLTYKSMRRGVHPLRTFFNLLKRDTPELSNVRVTSLINGFLTQPEPHHCNGFIASGNATPRNQLVISNSMWGNGDGAGLWWWSYYITTRWNIVLDITPNEGHRVIMASAPGYIWSNHDFYQNDVGIVMLETTLPQGLYTNRGFSLAVRARTAMQYSNSIDDVIYYLRYKNDGCMNAIWLIGDTKTGEIARFELGLYQYATYRTFDGFYWSSNNPMDLGVRLEKFNAMKCMRYFLVYLVYKVRGFEYYTPRYRPADRDIKFEELGNKYYGEIDIDIVKEIMSTPPMINHSPDCKLTDSNLLMKNGLWVCFGNPNGSTLDFENRDESAIKVEDIPSVGWVRLFGIPPKEEFTLLTSMQEINNKPDIQWIYPIENNDNDFYASSTIVDDVLFSTTSSGELYTIDAMNGDLLRKKIVGNHLTTPTIHNNMIYIGTSDGFQVFNKNSEFQWEKPIGKIVSNPIVVNNLVIVGNENGKLFAFDIFSRDEKWNITLDDEIYLSEPWNNLLFVGSGVNCNAINFETGLTEWVFETEGMITAKPYVKDDVVYFSSWDTNVYAIYAENKSLLWKYETGWGVETTPIISDGLVFVGSHDNNFYALNQQDGSLNWMFTCKSGIHSSPTIDNNNVYFGSDDGRFYALNKINGEGKWVLSPGYTTNGKNNAITTPILSDPVVNNEAVFIAINGNIYSI